MPPLAVIFPAAGSSTRFGRNKLVQRLDGELVILRALSAFTRHPQVSAIVVATNDATLVDTIRQADNDRVTFCDGGKTRADSVRSALHAVPRDYEWVAVHDAARPLITRELIDLTFSAAIEYGAAVPALPVSLTVKVASGPLPAKVQRTLARNELWAMQTPQIARRTDLLAAFERCPIPLDQVTDDVQLLELQGQDVWLVPGEYRNLKITTALDLKLAELLLKEWSVA